MKVLLKSSLKYITVITFLLGLSNLSYGQKKEASERLLDAEQELYELIQVDKSSLTRSEVKVWKKQKRHLERIINEEKERDDFYVYNRNRTRYGSSYYNPYGYRSGYYSPRFYRYPRRVIVVRR